MTIEVAIEILENHNKWRRGAEIPMVDPSRLGIAIETVTEYFRILKEL